MKILYDEGIAIHIVPESCDTAREGWGEAKKRRAVGRVLQFEEDRRSRHRWRDAEDLEVNLRNRD